MGVDVTVLDAERWRAATCHDSTRSWSAFARPRRARLQRRAWPADAFVAAGGTLIVQYQQTVTSRGVSRHTRRAAAGARQLRAPTKPRR